MSGIQVPKSLRPVVYSEDDDGLIHAVRYDPYGVGGLGSCAPSSLCYAWVALVSPLTTTLRGPLCVQCSAILEDSRSALDVPIGLA